MSATCQKVWHETTIPAGKGVDLVAGFEEFRNHRLGDLSGYWAGGDQLCRVKLPTQNTSDSERWNTYLDRATVTVRANSDSDAEPKVFTRGVPSSVACGRIGHLGNQMNSVSTLHYGWGGVGVLATLSLDNNGKLSLRVTWEENEKRMDEQFIHDIFHGVI